MKPTLHWYFDFLSPFSYFAWQRKAQIIPLVQDIIWHPTPLGPLLNHWGIKGPGEVEPKREFMLKTCLRYATRNKLAFTTPKTHPFNSLYALRLATKVAAGDLQQQVMQVLWQAGWQERIDMGNPDELLAVLNKAGLAAQDIYDRSFTAGAKKEIKDNIATGLEHGVFGVPSFVANGELFWGNDALEDLKSFVTGQDLLDRQKLSDLLASTPRAAIQTL